MAKRPIARTLPHLLASLNPSLPASSSSSSSSSSALPTLIRPVGFPPSSFYRITRAALKFRPRAYIAARSQAPDPTKLVGKGGVSSGGGRDSIGRTGEGAMLGLEEMGKGGELRASGRVWGQLFWEGQYVRPKSPLSKPDPPIHGGSKRKWVVVDPSSLAPGVLDAIRAAPLVRDTPTPARARASTLTATERTTAVSDSSANAPSGAVAI